MHGGREGNLWVALQGNDSQALAREDLAQQQVTIAGPPNHPPRLSDTPVRRGSL